MQTRLIGGAVYFTRAQLEASNPSRREGTDAVAEARWRSTTSKLVKTAIKTLKLPDWVYETSMNYINRFFLTRSIGKNDRHLVVGGAVLLASKVQESPRPVQDVAYVLLQLKHANKQKPQLGPDQTTLEQFIEGVMLAEQAILFSLNFNLNVETHVSLARRLLEPLDLWAKANPAPEEIEANQLKLSLYGAVMFFLNDSALTNLSLQYPNSKIAPVALIMAAKRIAAARYIGKEIPSALQRVLALANDAAWFESKGLSLEAAAGIEAQINELYATAPAQPPVQQRQPQGQASQPPHATAAALAGAVAGGTPGALSPSPRQKVLPLQHPLRGGKRVSDGDECTGGEQQATSELQTVPEQQQPEADVDGQRCAPGSGPCPVFNGLEDSANENCSPNGLTTGNASGSGCGAAEGQPEVCSRTDAQIQPLQSQPTQPQPSLDIPSFESSQPQSQPYQCGKRIREDGITTELAGSITAGMGVLAPPGKVRRLEDSKPVSLLHGP
ncbi:cyclin [Volvox carteri f. nagariensis]|uniref:Cyclin n=1 Tax=Volvox carteri f. nagariensis TaxID=3068 RepID=D8UFB9_VOLCA|nr:cyclin [Volvox carteri f. nagariensis]EFJ41581.1 cyclin [Volvox carteri f. nagariensis]|eukprot:XP_002957372.1 cyclin [Volvox carteri f. nagariensis]